MERKDIIGDINEELEEIERMNEKKQEANENYRYTVGGPVLSILCC